MSTARTNDLSKRRIEAGWVRLNGWLEPEAAAALAALAKAKGKTPTEAIAELLRDAARALPQ